MACHSEPHCEAGRSVSGRKAYTRRVGQARSVKKGMFAPSTPHEASNAPGRRNGPYQITPPEGGGHLTEELPQERNLATVIAVVRGNRAESGQGCPAAR
jgi:hypothetical protein